MLENRAMKILSAKDAKYGFGRLIDLARAEPVLVAKHGRPVVVVMAVEEYERLKVSDVSGEDSNLTRNKTVHPTDIEKN
jgi:prevent-host-death family protein